MLSHVAPGRRALRRPAVVVVALAAVLAAGCSDGSGRTAARRPSTSDAPRTTVREPTASTVTGVLALGRPIVLAHAGGDDINPHDTPFAFDRSAALGVDVLDMDVQLSADGVLVVQHDTTVDRTTNGSGAVASLTYEQLHALDAAYWFTRGCTCRGRPDGDYVYRGVRTGAKAPPAGARPDDFAITSFEQVARSHPGWVLNIEIKGSAPDALPAATELARLVKELGLTERVVVTSFDDAVVDAFAAQAPGAAITPGLGATTAFVLEDRVPTAGRTILQVPPSYEGIEVVTPQLVQRAHAAGLVLWVWPDEATWETRAGYSMLLDLGVDGVNAADPATAVEVLDGRP